VCILFWPTLFVHEEDACKLRHLEKQQCGHRTMTSKQNRQGGTQYSN
jgi:hypothetical protein